MVTWQHGHRQFAPRRLRAAHANTRWNTLEISAQGDQLSVKLNGQLTAQARDSKHAKGYLALQYGSGVVKFRKVQMRTN